MPTTTFAGLRYPQNSDGPYGPQQIQNLATDLDAKVIVPVATPSARTALTGVPAGLQVYEQSTKRFYVYDGAAWKYAGGAPAPIVACAAGAGWNIYSAEPPGAYIDSSGQVHLVGAVTPATGYNPQDGGTHTACVLPVGYRPVTARPLNPIIVTGIPLSFVSAWVDTSGVVSITNGTSSSVGVGATHYLDGLMFHPTYNNAVPLT